MKKAVEIGKTEVEHVANLARLEIAESDKGMFCDQFSQIVSFMDRLRHVPTDEVPQTATVVEGTNIFRDDVPRPSLPVEKATANAPLAEHGLFVVPKILAER